MFVKGNYSFDLEIFYFRILGWWNGVCMYIQDKFLYNDFCYNI